VGVVIDVTEGRQREEHLRVVMSELNHRVKNTLAVIEALAAQTALATDDMSEFTDVFGDRLRAMSKAHSILTSTEWRGAELGDLLRSELEARTVSPEQIELDGPAMMLEPKAALAMSMAVHELATNAQKYGALSAEAGTVRVTWRRSTARTSGETAGEASGRPDASTNGEAAEPGDELEMTWTELGGPQPSDAREPGFGTTMIDAVISHDLGGTIDRSFADAGFSCAIRVPIRWVIAGAGVRGVPSSIDAATERAAVAPTTGEADAPRSDRVLVVEDDSLIAGRTLTMLGESGLEAAGPLASVADAVEWLERETPRAALLDLNLRGERAYPIADRLLARGVAFAFITGYNVSDVPTRFAGVPMFKKPLDKARVTDWLRETIDRT
jgi:two-component sensor histidine kinase